MLCKSYIKDLFGYCQTVISKLTKKTPEWRHWIYSMMAKLSYTALREKCPNTEKYGPEKTPYGDTFQAA